MLFRRPLLDLLLPMRCLLCDSHSGAVCDACEVKLQLRPRIVERQGFIGVAAVDYRPQVAALVTAFKEQGQTTLASGFANAMAEALIAVELTKWMNEQPILVPIPSHPESTRGFTPAAELAKALAPRLGLNWLAGITLGSAVRDQAGLSAELRLQNLVGTMSAKPWLQSAPVLLVDDLVTTGSTMQEARRALLANQCRPLGFIAFAETLKKLPHAE